MQSLICEACGSNNLIKVGAEYVCVACGTKIISERQLSISEDVENYLGLFWRYRQERDYVKALSYLDKILEIDIKNPIANIKHFSTAWRREGNNLTIYDVAEDIQKHKRICINMTIPIVFLEELNASSRTHFTQLFLEDTLDIYKSFKLNMVKLVKLNPHDLSPMIDIYLSLDEIAANLYKQNIVNDKILVCVQDACHDLRKEAINVLSSIILSCKNPSTYINHLNRLVELIQFDQPSYTPPPFRSFKESYL